METCIIYAISSFHTNKVIDFKRKIFGSVKCDYICSNFSPNTIPANYKLLNI